MVLEEIGKRIARLRQEFGWTQQTLAERLAISRVAVSHIEMDISVPGERTITLLAGLFKLTPHDLVAGTTYPAAKADRLPSVVCAFTCLERDLELLRNDLAWLTRLQDTLDAIRYRHEVWERWASVLERWEHETADEQQRGLLQQAWEELGESNIA